MTTRSKKPRLLGFVIALMSTSCLAQTRASAIYDYMVMDVCVDASDRLIPGLSPTDPSCSRPRNIAPGEKPPYHLRNFNRPRDSCAGARYVVLKENVPVTRGRVTRIVSSYSRVADSNCKAANVDGEESEGGVSIQWHDGEYGFIMGSWSPVALSSFNSPACWDNPDSSRRFFRAWVIAPESLPQTRRAGTGVFESAHATGQASQLMGSCPARFRKALTTWFIGEVTFRSGFKLDAVVSSHYAQVDQSGMTPGKAMQVERTYWTKEFGLSRWEKWARQDWTHPRSGISAIELARRVPASGRCSTPTSQSNTFNAALEVRTGTSTDTFSEIVTDTRAGEQHVWVMTLCEDYTNITRGAKPTSSLRPDEAYWRE